MEAARGKAARCAWHVTAVCFANARRDFLRAATTDSRCWWKCRTMRRKTAGRQRGRGREAEAGGSQTEGRRAGQLIDREMRV